MEERRDVLGVYIVAGKVQFRMAFPSLANQVDDTHWRFVIVDSGLIQILQRSSRCFPEK
jgi:hypothetical protein